MGKKRKAVKKSAKGKEEVVKLEILDEDEIKELDEEKKQQQQTESLDKNIEKEEIDEIEEKNKEDKEDKEDVIVTNDFEVVKTKRLVPIVIIVSIVVFFLIISLFMVTNKLNKNVYRNVYLNGQNMSNMNEKEVNETIKKIASQYKNEVKIDLIQGEKVIDTVTQADIDFSVNIEETQKKVFGFGRDSNIFVNNYNIFKSFFIKNKLDIVYKYDNKKLEELYQITSSLLKDKVLDDSYEIDEETHELVLIKGSKGNGLNKEKFEKDIVNLLKENKTKEYLLTLEKKDPKTLDSNTLYKGIKRDAKDAEVIEEKGKKPIFNKEIYGHDIDKNVLSDLLEQLKLKKEKETIKFKLKVIEPKVKYKDIAWTKFEDVLGSLTTRFPAYNKNRATNLSIALSKLNGIIVMPGEVFSFNKIIGDTTAAKGYKPAATFKGVKVVNELGGGICQSVSTLYNAVLYANLQIVARRPHSLAVGYVRPGLDATMYYPGIDFKFKNTRDYPIKIKTTFSWNGNMSVSILGTREDVEYKIELSSRIISKKPFETVYEVDPNMAPGTEKVEHSGVDGYTSEAYKITKLNGKVIKRELLSRDTYKPTTKFVKKGPDAIDSPEVEGPSISESEGTENNNNNNNETQNEGENNE